VRLYSTTSGFADAVAASFHFLTDRFGFKIVRRAPTFVRYESSHIFVNIYHGRSSYEIGLEVGLRGDPLQEEKFTLGDILEAVAAPQRYSFLQASTQDRVAKYVRRLADLALAHGEPVFGGDKEVFAKLRSAQGRQSQDYLLGIRLARARKAALAASQRQDYAAVIRILKPLRDHLTASEAKRLQYAERRNRRKL